jgi:hypothetical protein
MVKKHPKSLYKANLTFTWKPFPQLPSIFLRIRMGSQSLKKGYDIQYTGICFKRCVQSSLSLNSTLNMKKLGISLVLTLLAITILRDKASFFQSDLRTNQSTVLSQKVGSAKIDKNWFGQIQQNMVAREYNIQWQAAVNAYSSPNRQNNLRATYNENGFSLNPRVDSVEKWNLSYLVEGLYRNEEQVMCLSGSPQVEVKGGTFVQHFKNGFHIEYQNDRSGVRQNFIIEKKPIGQGNLTVRLQTAGSLFPVKKGKHDILMVEQNGESENVVNRIWYKELQVFDANGRQIPATLEALPRSFDQVSERWLAGIDLVVNDLDATYPLLIDPLSTSAISILECNQWGADMGISVASAADINGDGFSDVIVGARAYDDGENDEGAAFAFYGSATGIITTNPTIMESNQPDAMFGSVVASAGDVNGDGYSDVIVAAPSYDNSQIDEGAAFMFYGSIFGINTSFVDTIKGSQMDAYFGSSIASAGDVNGDGYSDVIVGSRTYDGGENDEGAVFVYYGSIDGIDNTFYSAMESNQNFAGMGVSVASAGDVNGDGYSDVIVGADGYDNGENDEGAAFVFHGSSTGIITTIASIVESNQSIASMGRSVASAGDVDGDGYSDVIVGAYYFNNGQSGEGAAFIYHGSALGIDTTAVIVLKGDQSGMGFGSSVACSGDLNGDGYSDVIVGIPGYSNGQSSEGAVMVYLGSFNGISILASDTIESNQDAAFMGNSVASAGDVNGDGYSDVIVGAYRFDNGEQNEGAAFMYHGSPSGINISAISVIEGNQIEALLGISVACAGDVNGDGYSDIIIGSNYYDNGEIDEGTAFICLGSISGMQASVVVLESNQSSSEFGISVASAGDVNGDGYSDVIIGSPGYQGKGAAFVYYGSNIGISPTTVNAEISTLSGIGMGSSVASAGDVNGDGYSDVIVGIPGFANGQIREGGAIIYLGSPNGIDTMHYNIVESNQDSAMMGYSVGSGGDVNGDGYSDVVVGAPFYENGESMEGAVYVFQGSACGINNIASTILESNQNNAEFGIVASAGDVNGDGYGDIVVGAPYYSNNQFEEGAAYIFHGSASGINTNVELVLECNQNGALMGISVSSAGDINSDGYSDIIVGALEYDNGEFDEGAAFLYYGSTNGINSGISSIIESNQAGADFGESVASAGDINGDGYSDVIVSAPAYDNGEYNEGGAFVYFGNEINGLSINLLQLRPGTNTSLGPGGVTEVPGQVHISMTGKSYLGRQKGKLVWEIAMNAEPFSIDGGKIGNSVDFSGMSSVYTEMIGANSTTFSEELIGLRPSVDYKWRCRIRYDPTTAITGQMFGPWHYYKSRTPEIPMLGFKTMAITDLIPPSIICPNNINIRCQDISTWAIPYPNDNCGIDTFVSNHSSGEKFPSGPTTVIYTATDISGNTSSCSFTVMFTPSVSPHLYLSYGVIGTTIPYRSFQWYMDTIQLQGRTSSTISPGLPGLYYAQVEDSNGCVGMSDSLFFNPLSATSNHFLLYPNPLQGESKVIVKTLDANYFTSMAIEVRDISGQRMRVFFRTNFTGEESIPLEDLVSGVYQIEIKTNGYTEHHKVMIW